MNEEKFLTKKDDEFGTPDYLFKPLHEEFQFTVDAAATKQNTKLKRYVTKEADALETVFDNERVFCNPPYSRGNVEAFVRHFWEQTNSSLYCCQLAVLLVPTKTEQPWFHELRPFFELRMIKGRIKFIGGASGARDTHMYVIFRNHKWTDRYAVC